MNRRDALKLLGLGGIAAVATSLQSKEPAALPGHDEFIAWLRENAPMHRNPYIIVAGRPKSGRTNLMALLNEHYRREKTLHDFREVRIQEVTLNRDFTHTSDAMNMACFADIVFVTDRPFDEGARRGCAAFNVLLIKNRWGAQDSKTFQVQRMPSHIVQKFVWKTCIVQSV